MTTDLQRRESGFTLVELMISLVLGLIVIGGSLAMFASQRVTTRLSGEMTDVQADGRLALDAMARDLRAAGDFGCWPVANPIDGRLNSMVFDVTKGGIVGYTAATLALANSSTAPNGVDAVKAVADGVSAAVALTGVNGTLTNLSADMAGESDGLSVKTPVEPFKANDVAVITDCINWAKFQVTDVAAGAADSVKLLHAGGVLPAYGGGNKDGNLGASFRKDSTVGRLDTVWWFIGTVDKQKGLYRLSARDGAPVLVSKRIYAIDLAYDIDVNDDGVVAAADTGKKASDLLAADWPRVRSVNIQMLLQSEKTADAGGKVAVTSFAGVTVPTDKRVYLPLQMNVALRNQ